jgi:hypothetical protein
MIIKFKQFNENLLVPRNLEGRKEKLKQMNIKLLSQEVIDGDLNLDESFMDINAKFVKLKKVNGDVYLNGGLWTEIPAWLKDVEITGFFDCALNKLTTMKNCPLNIHGSIYLEFNKLKSLEGCPDKIKSYFYCHNNMLTTLEGCPKEISGDLTCKNNPVKLELPNYVNLKGKFVN